MFIRYFVELPFAFEEVEQALLRSPGGWILGVAGEASDHGEALLSEVGFGRAGRRVEKNVEVEVGSPTRLNERTIIPFSWNATGLRALFPVLDADFEVATLGQGRTQLALSGRYQPPLGSLGQALDRALLHRVAEATVKDFLDRVAERVDSLIQGRDTG